MLTIIQTAIFLCVLHYTGQLKNIIKKHSTQVAILNLYYS